MTTKTKTTAKKDGGDARSEMLRHIMPHLSGKRSKALELSIQNNDGQAFRTYWDMVGTTIEENLNEEREKIGNPNKNKRVTAQTKSIAQMKADLERAEKFDCSKMDPSAAKKIKEFKEILRDNIKAMELMSAAKVLASDPIKVKIDKYKATIKSLEHRIKEALLSLKDAATDKKTKIQKRIQEMKDNINHYKQKIIDAGTKFRDEFQKGLKGKVTAHLRATRKTLPIQAKKLEVIYA